MVRRLAPDTIVVYSQAPDDIFGKYRDLGIEIIHIENYHQRIRKKPTIAMDLEFFVVVVGVLEAESISENNKGAGL